MHRDGIPEPARYYRIRQTIVIRSGLLLCEERRHLFHELIHADREDDACHSSGEIEGHVERMAVRWALPRTVLERCMPLAEDWAELAELVKLPEEWVRFRWQIADRSEREHLFAVNYRRAGEL